MAIIIMTLEIYLISLIISLICGTIRFMCDVKKWKESEKKFTLESKKDFEKEITEEEEMERGKEDDRSESECDTPIIF